VTSLTQDTDKLVSQIGQQQVSQQQLARERKTRDDLVKTSQSEVTQGTQALQEAKQFRAQKVASSADLDAAIAQQEQLLAQAQHQVDLLATQRARV
jgi:Skp family chaperone for outer membrane proteins